MKIIIIGAGKVGRSLAESLSAENHDITVIDKSAALIDNLVNVYDIIGLCGNGASYDTLENADAKNTDLLIACAAADEINILACMVAKKLGVKHTIARVRNPEYEKQLRLMREDLGLSMVINPEKATAHEISRVLRFPTAIKLESFSKGRVELLEYMIGRGSPLDGVALNNLRANVKANVLICAIEKDGQVEIPSGDSVLSSGSTVYITASPEELEAFFRHLGVLRAGVHNAMIVGANDICYYLSKDLERSDIKVKIIDNDEKRCRVMSERLGKALVINGDATDMELLAEEGISQTDAFVALASLDEANIMLSMYAMNKGVGKVVAKINNRSFTDLVSHTVINDSIVSTSSITAELILQYVRAMRTSPETGFKTMHRIVGGRVEALEFAVAEESGITGKPIMDLDLRDNILIAVIVRRNGQIVIPNGRDVIEAGDSVIIVTTDRTLTSLAGVLKRGGAKK